MASLVALKTSHSYIPRAYLEAYTKSIEDPEAFWEEVAQNVHWFRPYNKVLDTSNAPFFKWFPGGLFNTCYNALDIHVEQGRGHKVAVIYDSPLSKVQLKITYAQLLEQVATFAGALQSRQVKKGDCVLIYLPMVPEAFVAMLACARIGAIHSVVFGGFAAAELANRINAATPKCILTASCGFVGIGRTQAYKPIVEAAIELSSHKPDFCVVLQRSPVTAVLTPGKDISWGDFIQDAKPIPCVPLDSNDFLYVLYTSGTTGDPKGIVRDNAGHCAALKWTMDAIYGAKDDTVFWAASDIGWVVGHSYIVYAPLFRGLTTLMYDGKPVGTPDAGAFWRVMAQYKVNIMFTAPTAYRVIRKEDPNAQHLQLYDMSALQAVYLAGERSDPGTLDWLQKALQRRLGTNYTYVFDHYWQTETAWSIAGPCPGLSGGHNAMQVKFGSCHRPAPGYLLQLMNEDCETPHPNPSFAGDETYPLAVRLPLPPGSFPTLYKNDQRYKESYVTTDGQWYKTGDAGYIDEDGFLYVMTRTDDIINVAGHRLATSAMEEVLASHRAIAECAVFGVPDAMKGQLPMACVVLKDGFVAGSVAQEACTLIRERIGAIACFSRCEVVPRLPKTRSGKILRKELSKIAAGLPYAVPPTIEDSSILPVLESILGPRPISRL